MNQPGISGNAQYLLQDDRFVGMPTNIQSWILNSQNATAEFAAFFKKEGAIEGQEGIRMPAYSPENPPRIYVNLAQWNSLLEPNTPEWPQRHMFGTLAHEIGHDKFNIGSVPFTGKTAKEYVQYRSGLEAQAIFNAFPIFKDLEHLPEFKDSKPFRSIGYLNEIELGALYGDWKAGKLDDAAVVKQITAKVADAPYSLANPPQDVNHDGRITHRDAYLRDFDKVITPRLDPQTSVDRPVAPFGPDKALGEKLRGLVGTLDQQANKGWDGTSERLWGAAFVMGTENRFTAHDDLHLAFNKPTEQYAAGEILHLSRSGPNASRDPYENRANMPMTEVLSASVDERLRQVETIGLAQAEQQRLAQQQELTKGPDDPSRGGPKFTM